MSKEHEELAIVLRRALRFARPQKGGFIVSAVHRCNACGSVLAAVVTGVGPGGAADVSNPNVGPCFKGIDGQWHAFGCPSERYPTKTEEG